MWGRATPAPIFTMRVTLKNGLLIDVDEEAVKALREAGLLEERKPPECAMRKGGPENAMKKESKPRG